MTLWYTKKEMAVRIAWFYSAGTVSGSLGGLLAAGIIRLNGLAGFSAWRWVFIVEGSFTVLLGCLCVFYLPDGPESAWFLSDQGRKLLSERMMFDQPTSISKTMAMSSWAWLACILRDPVAWIFAIEAIFNAAACFSVSLFLPSIVQVCLIFGLVKNVG